MGRREGLRSAEGTTSDLTSAAARMAAQVPNNLLPRTMKEFFTVAAVVELTGAALTFLFPDSMVGGDQGESLSQFGLHSCIATSIAFAVFIWRARELPPTSDALPMVGFSLLVHHALRLCLSLWWGRLLRAIVDIVLLSCLFNAAREGAQKAQSASPMRSPERRTTFKGSPDRRPQ